MNKKVRFSESLQIYTLPDEDRKSLWEQYARDRIRFQSRISDFEKKLSNLTRKNNNDLVVGVNRLTINKLNK